MVSLANLNTPTQTVVSGEEAGVLKVMELAEEAGAAKTIRLQVGGRLPQRADEARAGGAGRDDGGPVLERSGRCRWWRTTPASWSRPADDVREALVAQIASPVRWVDCVQTLAEEGCDRALELGPGRVLGGLIRKISPEIETLTADSRQALEAVPTRGGAGA